MSNIFYQIPNNSSTIGYTPLALKYNRRRLSQLIHCHEDTYLSRRERMVSHCFPHHLARTTFSILLLVTSHFPLPVQYGQNFSLQINQPHLKKKKVFYRQTGVLQRQIWQCYYVNMDWRHREEAQWFVYTKCGNKAHSSSIEHGMERMSLREILKESMAYNSCF